MSIAVIVALVAALGAPVLTYIVAVRKLSGKIATSEAADLWAESGKIRLEYREQIATLTGRCRRLEEQLDGLMSNSGALKAQIAEQAQTIGECRMKIAKLELENTNLKGEIVRLEGLLNGK